MERKPIGMISFVDEELPYKFTLRFPLPINAIAKKGGWNLYDGEFLVYELRGMNYGAEEKLG